MPTPPPLLPAHGSGKTTCVCLIHCCLLTPHPASHSPPSACLRLVYSCPHRIHCYLVQYCLVIQISQLPAPDSSTPGCPHLIQFRLSTPHPLLPAHAASTAARSHLMYARLPTPDPLLPASDSSTTACPRLNHDCLPTPHPLLSAHDASTSALLCVI